MMHQYTPGLFVELLSYLYVQVFLPTSTAALLTNFQFGKMLCELIHSHGDPDICRRVSR